MPDAITPPTTPEPVSPVAAAVAPELGEGAVDQVVTVEAATPEVVDPHADIKAEIANNRARALKFIGEDNRLSKLQ
jgi:hypothetical protein